MSKPQSNKVVVVPTPTKKEKDKKKKKEKSWASVVSDAVQVAGQVALAALPFLFANHAPTQKALAASPGVAMPTTSVPYASTPSLGSMTGVKAFSVVGRNIKGSVDRVRLRIVDELTALPSSALSLGALMGTFQVNPFDPIYDGTQFQQHAMGYEKFRIRKGAFVYAPSCDAATQGAIAAGVSSDPTMDAANFGAGQGVRILSSLPGADVFQVWQAGCFGIPPSKDLFILPNGGNIRDCSAGSVGIVAAASIAGGESPGTLYQLIDVEFSSPATSATIPAGATLRFVDTTAQTPPTANKPLALLSTEVILFGGADIMFLASGNWHQSGTARSGTVISGLPPGDYQVHMWGSGTGITGAGAIVITDEGAACGVVDPGLSSTAFNVASSSQFSYDKAISVPFDCPNDVPQIGFTALTATSQTFAGLIITRIPEDIYTGDSVLMGMPFKYVEGRSSKFCSLQKVRRSRFYDQTLQGKEKAQAMLVSQLSKDITDLRSMLMPPDAPAKVAGSVTAAAMAARGFPQRP